MVEDIIEDFDKFKEKELRFIKDILIFIFTPFEGMTSSNIDIEEIINDTEISLDFGQVIKDIFNDIIGEI